MRPGRITRVIVVIAGIAVLAACARGGPGVAPPRGETRDRVTASDEPDGTRRARVRLELAGAYYSRGQMTTALDEVKLAINADPTMAAAFNLRGLIYSSLGDNALAEDSFRRALALDRRDADVMQNYGWYLCQQGRYPEAHALFQQALEVPQYRDTPRTLLAKGVCQARSGQVPAAEATLQRAYELEPSNPAIGVNLAEVLLKRGNLERARFIIRRVNAQAEVVNAQTLWLAARIDHKLGNRDSAQSLGDQLRARFPQSPEASAYERRQFDE
jgi:type IV pilus assembly protein PilF